jgi:hypothetical protein
LEAVAVVVVCSSAKAAVVRSNREHSVFMVFLYVVKFVRDESSQVGETSSRVLVMEVKNENNIRKDGELMLLLYVHRHDVISYKSHAHQSTVQLVHGMCGYQ